MDDFSGLFSNISNNSSNDTVDNQQQTIEQEIF